MEDGTIIGDVDTKSDNIVHWVIPAFSTLPRRAGSRFKSRDFKRMNDEWLLEIYPNGVSQDNTRMHIRLHRKSLWCSYPVSCTVGVMPEDYEEETLGTGTFHTLSRSFYILNRTRSELENRHTHWLPDGELTVTLLFEKAAKKHKSQANRNATSRESKSNVLDVKIGENERLQDCTCTGAEGVIELSENLKALLNDKDYDMRIFVKGREFHAHRLILKARSRVLRKMLSHDSKEKNSGTIHIDDCDPDCFGEFLLFLYAGRIENLTTSKALRLYYVADKYELLSLKQQCVHFLAASLCATSFWDVILLAVKHGEEELLSGVAEYIAKNLKTILFTSEWQSFLSENPVIANELYIKSLQNLGHLT